MFNKKKIERLEKRLDRMENLLDSLESRLTSSTQIRLPNEGYTFDRWGISLPINKLMHMLLTYLKLGYKTCTTEESLVRKDENATSSK